ncbi:hypothetical protein LCGC14_0655310 [marine sediment metagenome]|uniref:Uncharacterized protein n=1 Tax=marine sediment metagenome TaxID=412755 RepID=A0A0F9R0A2_9ZZZZ
MAADLFLSSSVILSVAALAIVSLTTSRGRTEHRQPKHRQRDQIQRGPEDPHDGSKEG